MAEFALETGATHIVRSLRVAMDFDYEYQMTLTNHYLAPDVQTVYLPAEQGRHAFEFDDDSRIAAVGQNSPTVHTRRAYFLIEALIADKHR